MLRYLILATIGTALFYLVYWLLLRKDGWFHINRWYLLSTLALSLLLPLMHITVANPMLTQFTPDQQWLGGYQLGEVAASTSVAELETATPAQPLLPVWMWVYLVGVAVMATMLIADLYKTVRLLQRYSFERQGSLLIALPDDETPAFSFLNRIVIGRKSYNNYELQQMLRHEQTHSQHHHTADLLFVRAVRCLLWFNPIVWLYERHLKLTHEYLADDAVIQQYSRQDYVQLLFHQTTGIVYSNVTNNFNYSSIKKRIKMTKQKKSHFVWAKVMLALPVAGMMLFANCQSTSKTVNIADGTYQVLYTPDNTSWGDETYQAGQLVSRQIHGVEVPQESIGNYMVFDDLEEAENFAGSRRAEYAQVVTLVPSSSADTTRYYEVLWGDKDSYWLNPSEHIGSPEFDGDNEGLAAYLSSSIHYPEEVKTAGIQGKVFVQFTIEPDGKVSNAKILRGFNKQCEEEVLRVVNAMPKWKPATFNGKPTRTNYVLPVTFNLQ